jgi:hypothetical protein
MSDNRTVTVAWTSKTATFTQRGYEKLNGFIRLNGKTITGYRLGDTFYPYTTRVNSEVPYSGDSRSW